MSAIGLYLHIPFCARKCSYCDFPSWAGQMARREPYVKRLLEEMGERSRELGHPAVDTVYIGGGTPSLLMPGQMAALLQGVHEHFALTEGCEISCEANPGALTDDMLDTLRRGGVNRLSLGAQSADPALLGLLGRQHSWPQVEQAAACTRAHGFDNLNIDLMLGVPGQTLETWQRTLEAALALKPEHLSCYGLIPEEGTELTGRIQSGELSLPEEAQERAMYDHTLQRLREAGYIQYEISNFALPGHACLHNVHCWQRQDYLGLGTAAHSLLGDERRVNPADIDRYLAGDAPEREALTPQDKRFESLMLGLRMTRGVDLEAFEAMHGIALSSLWQEQMQPSLQAGLTELTGDGHFRLTRRGMDVMNAVLLDFL